MTLVPTTLRILHLSDIHFREAAGIDARARQIQRETPRRARVMAGEAWRRNLSELLDDGAIDLVCITGDIADWGKPAEFELGSRFVEQLLDVLSLSRERLFVVPGNHDVDRRLAEAAWENMRRQAGAGTDELSDWMAGGPAPAGADAAWCDGVLEREAAFWSWVEHGLGRPELLPSRSPHGRLGYRVEIGATLGLHVPVWLLGLDTAWLAGSDGDAGKLRLTKDQLLLLGTDARGERLAGFRVALGHHPLGELADASEARQLLAEHVDVYLHGHQHQPASLLFMDPDRRLLELAAGCVFEGSRKDGHPNGLSVITVGLGDSGKPQEGELRFRSWSPSGGFWHDDSSIYRKAAHGRLELSWAGEPELLAKSTAVSEPKVAPTRLPHGAPKQLLEQAEFIQTDAQPGFPQLYAREGYQYCDLLLRPSERAAWRGIPDPEQLEVCSAVFARATQALAWATGHSYPLRDHALDHLTLARAALYATLLRPDTTTVTNPELTLASARTHLETAVAGLRKAGQLPELPPALITRAWLSVIQGHPTQARALLDEAWAISERGPMPLHQADIQLHRARLFHDRDALALARELIIKHEYGRRLPTLDDTEHVLALADDLHDRLRTALDLNEHRATIALVIAPLGLVADVELARDRLGLDPSNIATWIIDAGPRAREQITALNRSRDTLLTEKRLIWLRGSSSDDARFVRRAAPDLTASIDVFVDLRTTN